MKVCSVRFSWFRMDRPATENVPKDQAGDKVPHLWREDAHAHVLLHFVPHASLYKALSLQKCNQRALKLKVVFSLTSLDVQQCLESVEC